MSLPSQNLSIQIITLTYIKKGFSQAEFTIFTTGDSNGILSGHVYIYLEIIILVSLLKASSATQRTLNYKGLRTNDVLYQNRYHGIKYTRIWVFTD